MRAHYAEYVKHAMRFYSKSIESAASAPTKFETEADRKNWAACQEVIKTYPPEDQDLLVLIYSADDTIPDNVFQTAKRRGISQQRLWVLIRVFEQKFAIRRGLI